MSGSKWVAIVLSLVLIGAGRYYFGREFVREDFRKALTWVVDTTSASTVLPPGLAGPYVSTPKSNGWRVNVDTSPMDRSKTVALFLDANEPFTAWSSEEHLATLIIRCKEHKTDLYVVNGTNSDSEYGLTDEATVRLRLDSSVALSQVWFESTDGEALFAEAPISLARRLARSQRLTYQFTPYNSDPAISTFDLAGLAEQLPRVADACGWKV